MFRDIRIAAGLGLLVVATAAALLAPLIASDPLAFNTPGRLRPPSLDYLFGSDNFGRSIFSRTIYGAQISLTVGLTVALISVAIGLTIGMVAGFHRRLDNVIMRIMDGVMAIPAILLAIALAAITGGGVIAVIAAITVPEIPRVVRLVRSVVLTIRELPFVDAAIASGSTGTRIMLRHILPNTIAPLVVQATYVAASAILTEAVLSFLGIGTPATTPTWGNMIANGRTFFAIAPWVILFPGIGLSLVVLSVNLLGDGLRDRLDPRLAHRMR
jgi:peptide/nickel transport system permease protein